MGIESYRDLNVWQLGIELVQDIYLVTQAFPKTEIYGMVSQMRRAAVSVPSNIAEGQQRDSTKDYLRHISISLGSLAELRTLLEISQRLQYVTRQNNAALDRKAERIGKMLRALQKSLKRRLQ
jgi:four helix bundle protein